MAPLLILVAVLLAPVFVKQNGNGRVARVVQTIREALLKVRSGARRLPRPAPWRRRALLQLGAWFLQLCACWALFAALGLDDVGIGAAAAVLFAVNVTAVVPATPSNIGVFQLAVISVLTTGFGVGSSDALAYGVILQAVEIATAVALGLPALVREGVTWQDMRLRVAELGPGAAAAGRRRLPDELPPSDARLASGRRLRRARLATVLQRAHPPGASRPFEVAATGDVLTHAR